MTFVSKVCVGERCFCGAVAANKIEEAIFYDDPLPQRHPLTSYVCDDHFRQIMGPGAGRRRAMKGAWIFLAAAVVIVGVGILFNILTPRRCPPGSPPGARIGGVIVVEGCR